MSLARLCVVYVVKEVASFPGARSINGRGAQKNARSSLRGSSSYRQARKIQKLLITVAYSRETV